MNQRSQWASPLVGIATVALWVAGLVVRDGLTENLSDHASDQQVLAWVQGNANNILLGGWLFMLGSLLFLALAGIVRGRLAAAEGGSGTLASIAFGGGVAAAVFGIAIPTASIALAINKDDISAATAGALHTLGDAFFVGAELSVVAFLVGTAIVALRSGVLPKLLAYFGLLVAVILVIGPIGWAGLIFGVPLWTLGLTVVLARRPRPARATAAATA